MQQLRSQLQFRVPGTRSSHASINAASGNLAVELPAAAGGPFDPRPKFTYNSRASDEAVAFGRGFADLYNPAVTQIDTSTAQLVNGVGAAYTYNDKDAGGKYLAPDTTPNALIENTGGGWTETLPDGTERRYDSTGALASLANPAGDVWTLVRSGDLLSALVSPKGGRTSYLYDASDNLKAVEAPSGERTSVTVDAAGDLTRTVRPDGTIVSLLYDADHRIQALLDAEGNRVSFSYDGIRRVRSVTNPTGGRDVGCPHPMNTSVRLARITDSFLVASGMGTPLLAFGFKETGASRPRAAAPGNAGRTGLTSVVQLLQLRGDFVRRRPIVEARASFRISKDAGLVDDERRRAVAQFGVDAHLHRDTVGRADRQRGIHQQRILQVVCAEAGLLRQEFRRPDFVGIDGEQGGVELLDGL